MGKSDNAKIRMKTRIKIVTVVVIILGLFVPIFGLYKVQIKKGEYYQNAAYQQQTKPEITTAERGNIYDASMRTLASSAKVWTIAISPHDIKSEEELEKIASFLSKTLDLDYDSIIQKGQNKKSSYEVLKKKVEKDVADKIREFKNENEYKYEINLYEDFKRYYHYGSLASQILGFTNVDNEGAYGIESYYNKYLAGTDGVSVSIKNALSGDTPFSFGKSYEAENGNSIVLTIDAVIQESLEKNLALAIREYNVQSKATGIVMNVKTGAILGMSSIPDFDPNDPYIIKDDLLINKINSIEDEDKKKEESQNALFSQWRNKAISDSYEPGSVFKLVTAATALETNSATPYGSYYNCTGSYEVNGREKGCWKKTGHGTIDFAHAVMYSCNPAFMQIGAQVGPEDFQNYCERFGITENTGIDLPGEGEGVFYSDLVKLNKESAEYLASSSFGQTFTVTPIQMMVAASAVANGGKLVEPYVVSKIVDEYGTTIEEHTPVVKRNVISKDTSEILKEIMEDVVDSSDGSGRKAYIPGYRVGGKTGTSEKLNTIVGDYEEYAVSFFGVAPMDDPEIAVLVVLDEPQVDNIMGSVIAAPVTSAILNDALNYLGIEKVFKSSELAVTEVKTPSVVGLDVHDAISELLRNQLDYKVIGNGTKVTYQNPPKYKVTTEGEEGLVSKNSTIYIYTDDNPEIQYTKMPDVVDINYNQANRTILNAKLNVKYIETNGTTNSAVKYQNNPEGTKLEVGSVVTITLGD